MSEQPPPPQSSPPPPGEMRANASTPGDPDGPIVGAPSGLPILSRAPETLPPLPRPGKTPEWAMRLGVLALACALFLPNLGSFGLWDPWETHYGEVTRYMVETGDWVHPWWGYHGEQIGEEKGPGEAFYSKPILLFWMEAATIRAIGLSETAIRFPVALIAILCMFVVYYAFSKLLGRPKGILIAVVMATSPQFYFLARQSQTDMPFVGTLTIAMSFFALAVFGPRQRTSDRRMWGILALTLLAILAVFLPQLGIVAADVNHEIPPGPGGVPGGVWATWANTGWQQAATFGALMAGILIAILAPVVRAYTEGGGTFSDAFKDKLRRQCALWMFYTFSALSLMGKGLLGFMLPGAVIFVYLLITNEWTLIVQPLGGGRFRGRLELWRGLGIFVCVGLPWYVALLSGPEGTAFWNRFFIHDHFNRLGSGVHHIDDGTFEHFFKWLGYGMWPWVAFVPVALVSLWRFRLRDRGPQNRLKLLIFLWFFVAWTLFSLSSTKFHHYIFPALPPLAMLIGWSLWDLLSDRTMAARLLIGAALGLFILVSWDIHENPQHLRNQFTYKYDREYPASNERPIDQDELIRFQPTDQSDWEPRETWAQGDFYAHTPEVLHRILNVHTFRFNNWLKVVGVLGLLSLGLMLAWPMRRIGLITLSITAMAMTLWTLNWYMPQLSPHWSQKYLFDKYFDSCELMNNPPQIDEAFTPKIAGIAPLEAFFQPRPKRVCKEEVISWLLTWRGETFYSNNTIRPIQKENKQFEPYLKELNKGARFYVHIERTRAKSFKGRADSHLKKLQKDPHFAGIKEYKVTLEHNENFWFVLLKADPVCKPGYVKGAVGRCLPKKKTG